MQSSGENMDRGILRPWVVEALRHQGGRATVLDVARHLWANHESDFRRDEELFLTWQYYYRWTATGLRQRGLLKAADASPRGVWELTERGATVALKDL